MYCESASGASPAAEVAAACLKREGSVAAGGPKIYFLLTPDINFIAGRGKSEASLA